MTLDDWASPGPVKVWDGLLPFHSGFRGGGVSKRAPPGSLGPFLSKGQWEIVAMRRDGGAVDHSGRSAIRAGCREHPREFEHGPRIDHRSLAERRDVAERAGDLEQAAELSRKPNVHLGPQAYRAGELERQDQQQRGKVHPAPQSNEAAVWLQRLADLSGRVRRNRRKFSSRPTHRVLVERAQARRALVVGEQDRAW